MSKHIYAFFYVATIVVAISHARIYLVRLPQSHHHNNAIDVTIENISEAKSDKELQRISDISNENTYLNTLQKISDENEKRLAEKRKFAYKQAKIIEKLLKSIYRGTYKSTSSNTLKECNKVFSTFGGCIGKKSSNLRSDNEYYKKKLNFLHWLNRIKNLFFKPKSNFEDLTRQSTEDTDFKSERMTSNKSVDYVDYSDLEHSDDRRGVSRYIDDPRIPSKINKVRKSKPISLIDFSNFRFDNSEVVNTIEPSIISNDNKQKDRKPKPISLDYIEFMDLRNDNGVKERMFSPFSKDYVDFNILRDNDKNKETKESDDKPISLDYIDFSQLRGDKKKIMKNILPKRHKRLDIDLLNSKVNVKQKVHKLKYKGIPTHHVDVNIQSSYRNDPIASDYKTFSNVNGGESSKVKTSADDDDVRRFQSKYVNNHMKQYHPSSISLDYIDFSKLYYRGNKQKDKRESSLAATDSDVEIKYLNTDSDGDNKKQLNPKQMSLDINIGKLKDVNDTVKNIIDSDRLSLDYIDFSNLRNRNIDKPVSTMRINVISSRDLDRNVKKRFKNNLQDNDLRRKLTEIYITKIDNKSPSPKTKVTNKEKGKVKRFQIVQNKFAKEDSLSKKKTKKKFGNKKTKQRSDSERDSRRQYRLPYFLPKRYHWDEDQVKDLGYFWFNGPFGKAMRDE